MSECEMKKCWICGRTSKDVDEEYNRRHKEYNRRHERVSNLFPPGETPDELRDLLLFRNINSFLDDDPIRVCVICLDTIDTIVEDLLDKILDTRIKRVLKGLLLSSLKEDEYR